MDYEEIEAVVGVLQGSRTLTELEIRNGDRVIRVRRASASAPAPKATPPAAPTTSTVAAPTETAAPPAVKRTVVTSHLVGIFYGSRTTPVHAGDTVKKGQVLGQIEAMRLMNDCIAAANGTIAAALVEDGQPVEYGQPLFEIEPTE